MECPSDNTVKQRGHAGACVFCEHTTSNGTPWPKGGVVCPCCIEMGLLWLGVEQ